MSGGDSDPPYDQVPEAALFWFLTRPCRRKTRPREDHGLGTQAACTGQPQAFEGTSAKFRGPQLPPNFSRAAPRGRATKSENRTSAMPQDALGGKRWLSTGMCQTRLKAPLWGQGVMGL